MTWKRLNLRQSFIPLLGRSRLQKLKAIIQHRQPRLYGSALDLDFFYRIYENKQNTLLM